MSFTNPVPQMSAGRKLGRNVSDRRNTLRTLKFAKYRTAIAPAIPDYANWAKAGVNWGMMLNDSLGDCTIAAAGHMMEEFNMDNAVLVTIPDSSVLTGYEQACGYVPGNPYTDQGGDMATVLKYMQQTGLKDTNGLVHKFGPYVSVNPMNPVEVKEAIFFFGAVYCGVGLPNTVQNEENPGSCWDVEPNWKIDPNGAAGSLGGHCIPLTGYSPKAYKLISWGSEYYMTPNFLQIYCDELYAVLDPEWLNGSTKLSPSLFNLAQLEYDLSVVTA